MLSESQTVRNKKIEGTSWRSKGKLIPWKLEQKQQLRESLPSQRRQTTDAPIYSPSTLTPYSSRFRGSSARTSAPYHSRFRDFVVHNQRSSNQRIKHPIVVYLCQAEESRAFGV